MDDRDWLILHTLYKEKSITKTGQALFIAQPTLTKRLKQIEAEFDVQIVTRGVKGVQFTPEGEYLAKRAEDLLFTFREIKEAIDNYHHHVAGTLRIGVSNFISKYKLPLWLKMFKDNYPNVGYEIITGYSRNISQIAYSHDIHVGIIRGDYNWPGKKILLFEEEICIVSVDKIEVDDLHTLPRINYQTDLLYKHMVDNWWAERFKQPPQISTTVDQGDTCKEMVMNGLGYAILPSLFFNEHDPVHKIPLTTLDGEVLTQKTWLIFHEEVEKLNVVNKFIEFMIAANR